MTAYDGQFCEKDRNGCAEASCYHGIQCYDVPAPGVGITCGACPSGYSGDGQNCIGRCGVCGVGVVWVCGVCVVCVMCVCGMCDVCVCGMCVACVWVVCVHVDMH